MKKLLLALFIFLGLATSGFLVYAATGTIDNTDKYAWSNNIGWINFKCLACNISVSDTAITGYAWSNNYGWINLNPTNGGVQNTTSGVLSGYAWGQSAGWINFSGVNISTSTGEFSGTATGNIVGNINFSCTEAGCPVTTDWRPTTAPVCNNNGSCDSGETCSTCPDCCGSSGGSHYICEAQKCVVITGSGLNQCTTDLECVTHTKCDAQKQCISVSGVGINECDTSNNCVEHNVCNLNKQCIQASGVGFNQCSVNNDCFITHNECNGSTCVAKAGFGINQCNNNAGCQNPKYNKCNEQKQCEVVAGVGNDECMLNNDCNQKHTVCNLDKQCIEVNGPGLIQCSTDNDCGSPKHNKCNGSQCVIVDGEGVDECQTDDGCKLVKHNICNEEKQCISIDGEGLDQCQTDEQCNLTHNECNDFQCSAIIGEGIDQCTDDNECKTPKYNKCNEQKQCEVADGDNPDECQTDNDCGPPTHTECNLNEQCISMPGEGLDQCNSSDDCQVPKYNKCNELRQCVLSEGEEPDECQVDEDCPATHTECNEEKQCITVDGEGTNQCQEDNDCNEPLIVEAIIDKIIIGPLNFLSQETKKIINTPVGSIATKTVSTTGVLIITAFDIFLILLRLIDLLLILFGFRRKVPPWGTVYDSITKQPLDPAYVTLKDLQGKEISSAITDLDGRYGFLVESGVYQMQANKTNYIFPSQKLAGKTEDELYSDLYFGEGVEIKKSGDVIIKNIPLDPLKFDWNEFAKKNKRLMIFYSKWDAIFRKIFDFLFAIGFIIAVISYVFAPYPYNAVIVTIYLILLLFRVLGLKPKPYGYIVDKNGEPLSFAIIRVIIPDSNRVITSKPVNKYGKYYCLVPPGRYYVKIEKKNEDGSYSLVYTSQIINATKNGIIKERFKV